mgnify:CR=1 FL=1
MSGQKIRPESRTCMIGSHPGGLSLTKRLFALADAGYAQAAAELSVNTASLGWGSFLLHNLLPVTLGNIAGGAGLGAVYWRIYLYDKKA